MAGNILIKQGAQLLQALLSQDGPLTASHLAAQLGISERTVRSRVRAINDLSDQPVIVSGRKGYTINVQEARALLETDAQAASSDMPQNNEERGAYALKRVIQSGEPVNIYDLCEEIYVSISTMKSALGKMRRRLAEFDLALEQTGGMLSVRGTEKNKRRMLSSLLYDEASANFMNLSTIQAAFPNINVEFVRNCVRETLEAHRYFVNDYSLVNLILHIAIAIDRIGREEHYGSDAGEQASEEGMSVRPHEHDMAHEIGRKLEGHFHITFPPSEEYELALLLAARTTMLDYQEETRESLRAYVDADCLALVDELIGDMEAFYFIDLSEHEFYVRFALHIKNLLTRAGQNAFARNPLTDEIKRNCPLLYDAAVNAAGTIKRRTGFQINDDEIAYIAFHLGSTIEAQKQLSSKVKVALFCPAYYNVDKNLQGFLERYFQDDILVTNVVTSQRELAHVAGADLIITTNPVDHVAGTPVHQIGIAPRETDIPSLRAIVLAIQRDKRRAKFRRQLLELIRPEAFAAASPLAARREIIHAMSERLCALGCVGAHFEDDVLEREELSSTAFGQVAIPHTMKPNASESSIAVLIPKHPVAWNGSQVSLVLLLAFSRGQRATFNELFDPLVSILMNPENVLSLRDATDCSDFVERLSNMLE